MTCQLMGSKKIKIDMSIRDAKQNTVEYDPKIWN